MYHFLDEVVAPTQLPNDFMNGQDATQNHPVPYWSNLPWPDPARWASDEVRSFPRASPDVFSLEEIRAPEIWPPLLSLTNCVLVAGSKMGILADILGTVGSSWFGPSAAVLILSVLPSFLVLAIVLNVLKQLLFKKPTEPPVVFHWIPFIGSTVTYGIDPYKFFFSCRAKV